MVKMNVYICLQYSVFTQKLNLRNLYLCTFKKVKLLNTLLIVFCQKKSVRLV